MQSTMIGVIGASRATEQGLDWAFAVGQRIAEAGAVLVCGGLGGVMEAACRGCTEAGGISMGILPGSDASDANPWVTLPVATNMGHARNIIIAHTAQTFIAVEGEYGTLSEMAIALKLGKPVATLGGWQQVPGAVPVQAAEEAVAYVLKSLEGDVHAGGK